MKRFFPVLVGYAVLLSAFVSPFERISAQTTTEEDAEVTSRFPLWTAKLPGGEISIALRSIQMVSSHEYLVDGGARVVEVNVGTNGPMVTRFYFIGAPEAKSPLAVGQTAINQVIDKAQALGERTGVDQAWKRVVKNYPTTTHAHTVEYRLDSEDDLRRLFENVSRAWKQGRGSEFKIEDK